MYKFRFINTDKKIDNDIQSLFYVAKRPVIPAPKEIVEEIKLGDGTTVYRHTGVYEDREIVLDCNFISNHKDEWVQHMSQIQQYFIAGRGRLELSNDDPSHYWVVKKVDVNISNRKIGVFSEFQLRFVCDPYRYMTSYSTPLEFDSTNEKKVANSFELAKPTYVFFNTAERATKLSITNNGRTFLINNPWDKKGEVGVDRLYLNSDDMYLLTQYKDGSKAYQTVKTVGAFKSLWLNSGVNTIQVESNVGAIRCHLLRNLREF